MAETGKEGNGYRRKEPHLGLVDSSESGKEEMSLRNTVKEESIEPADKIDVWREKEAGVEDG